MENNFKVQYLSGTKPMIYRGESLAQVNFIPFIPINDGNIHGKLWWISGWRNYDLNTNHIYLVGMFLYIPLYATNKQVYCLLFWYGLIGSCKLCPYPSVGSTNQWTNYSMVDVYRRGTTPAMEHDTFLCCFHVIVNKVICEYTAHYGLPMTISDLWRYIL